MSGHHVALQHVIKKQNTATEKAQLASQQNNWDTAKFEFYSKILHMISYSDHENPLPYDKLTAEKINLDIAIRA